MFDLFRTTEMKLLTHNFLSSAFLKNVKIGYPLILRGQDVVVKENDFDAEYTKAMLKKIDFPVLVSAAKGLNLKLDVPETVPEDWESNESFLNKIFQLIDCVSVKEGELECPESGRVFIIREFIPNMLANEDEVEEMA